MKAVMTATSHSHKFKPLVWFNATIVDPYIWPLLQRGSKVLIAESMEGLTLGPTWWVFDGKTARQVTRELGGKNLVRVATIGRQHKDQDLCNERFLPFWLQHQRILAGLPPLPAHGAKRRARDANGRAGPGAPAPGPKNGPKASKNVQKASPGDQKGPKQSPGGRNSGVKWGCGEGKTLDGKRSSTVAPAPSPVKPRTPTAQKGTIMQNQSNTTKTGKAIVRALVKIQGEVQTIRFVAGPKRVIVTGKGLPKIIVSGNSDEGFTAVCRPNPKKPALAVTSVAKTADLAYSRSVKANWIH